MARLTYDAQIEKQEMEILKLEDNIQASKEKIKKIRTKIKELKIKAQKQQANEFADLLMEHGVKDTKMADAILKKVISELSNPEVQKEVYKENLLEK